MSLRAFVKRAERSATDCAISGFGGAPLNIAAKFSSVFGSEAAQYRRIRAGPVTTLHDSINAGPYVVAPHSHSQQMCGPQEHGIVATIMCPGSSQ
jgi:hypothetical protein